MAYPTRIRYGLRLLARLAIQEESRRLPLSDVSRLEGVSVKYLEQIISLLKPLGILESARGAGGGYCLVKEASALNLAELFACLGGLSGSAPCLDDPHYCPRVAVCLSRPFWHKLDTHVHTYLAGMSLADIVANRPTPQGQPLVSL